MAYDNCTAATLFEALKKFGSLEDSPKDQFLSRYVFDIFLKNESLFGVNHLLYPKYSYRFERDAEGGAYLPARMDNIILLFIDFDDWRYPALETVERITFADAVGFIGGTIGIFTGFSIVSIFEMIRHISTYMRKYSSFIKNK